MSPLKTTAIVLKSINWKDTSKVVSLYTRDAGRVSVIAKGVRRLKNTYAGVLESINLVEVIIYLSSKRQVQVLGSVSIENSFPKIKRDLEKTSYAYALLELISILIPTGQTDTVFFDFIKTLLNEIGEMKEPKIILWFFLIKISSYMGFRPEFKTCTICAGNLDGPESLFSFMKGGLVCNTCNNNRSDGWQLNSQVREFLCKLQKLNYKTISTKSIDVDDGFPYTEFLLSYLRYHSEEKLELNSLKILK